jgi:hypothetical protein
MKKIQTVAKCGHNQFVFEKNYEKKWADEISKLTEKNLGKKVEITIEVRNRVEYYIYKYYWGYLIPDIANAYGDNRHYYIHEMMLKKRFLFRKENDFEMIPKKHRSKCKFIFDKDENLLGYIPSMSTITNDEAKEYIKQCEQFLFIECEGHVGQDLNGEKLNNYQEQVVKYKKEIFQNGKD